MFDFYEKRKIRGLAYSKPVIGLILILAVLLSLSVLERFSVEREMEAKREAKEAELENLQARAAALEAQVEHFENERGIEEELRNRFDVAKEGEQVIVILDDEKSSDADLDALSKPPGAKKEKAGSSFWDIFIFW